MAGQSYDYPDYSDPSPSADYSDLWGWDGSLVPVPGFGFLPRLVEQELEDMTQDFLREDFANMSNPENITLAEIDMYKCTMLTMTWQHFFPHLTMNKSQGSVCPPVWDGASCLPPSLAGATAVFPCMTMYNHKFFDTNYNASHSCLADGSWAPLTDYSHCRELCRDYTAINNQSRYIPCEAESDPTNDISIHIYFIGYSISLLALMAALTIFLSFREMRCLRHKIHIGLFLTFLLADLSWIATALIQNMINSDHYEVVVKVWCVSQVVLRYFHLTTFFWMFLEGLYLFLQVQLPLSLATVRHIHFLLIGWGFPMVNMTVWLVLRLRNFQEEVVREGQEVVDTREDKIIKTVESCPFLTESDTDLYAYKLPVFILLLINSGFLIWIMVIVVSKLRSRTAMDHDRRHYKAAKALVIVIPLLGFTYMLTLTGPRAGTLAYTVFQAVRAVLLSTQGFVISLPYCFLNGEVQTVVKNHWSRWKLVRNVGYECQTPRTSIYYAQGGGGSENKMTLMTTKVNACFLSVPKETSISTSKHSSRSVSFSEVLQPLSPDGSEGEASKVDMGSINL